MHQPIYPHHEDREKTPDPRVRSSGEADSPHRQIHRAIDGVREKVFVPDSEFGDHPRYRSPLPSKTMPTYQLDTKEEIIQTALSMNRRLQGLDPENGKTPEEIFGEEEWKNAFVSEADIENGTVELHCGCMDERVPDTDGGLKLGTAGSGILMTNFEDPRFANEANFIYAFLENPASGNDVFWAMVHTLKAKIRKGARVKISDHGGCGAAGMFCARFEGKNLDPAKAAKAAATRLQRALGLGDAPLHTDYRDADIEMNGDPKTHDAHCLIIDSTGRFRADALAEKIRGLKLSGITLLPDAKSETQNGYLRVELNAGSGIIAGGHGTGIHNAPLFIILDPSNPHSRTIIEQRYNLAQYEDRPMYFVHAPEAA